FSITPTSQSQYSTSFTVDGTLTINNGVTFAPTSGVITMSGGSGAISNSGSLTLTDFTVTGTISNSANGNITVSGTFTTQGGSTLNMGTGALSVSTVSSSG